MSRMPNWLASFLTGETDEEAAGATAGEPATTRRPTRVARPVGAAAPGGRVGSGPAPEDVSGAEGQVALPDFLDPPGAELVAGVDANGVEYVFEDDPYADPLVDPRYDADDRNWVRYRPNWGGYLRFLILGLLLLFVVLWARDRVYDWIDGEIDPGGPQGEEVAFVIPTGASTNDVASQLADEGIIGNATVFRYYVRCEGDITISGFLGCDTEVSFQAGEYDLFENMAFDDVIAVLEEGPKVEPLFTVTIPEGLRITELIDKALEENDLFDREGFEAALSDASLRSQYLPEDQGIFLWFEGMLFPATYDIPESELADERRFVERLSDEFDLRYSALVDEIGRDPVIDELGLTDYEVITIASLVEEEAKVDQDRGRMARGMYNRLLAGDILGVDASVYYANNKSFTEGLTAEDLANPSPYNTRLNPGIPPSPIAAPGEASLRAALRPEAGDEEAFYYWARTDEGGVVGAHSFASRSEGNAEIVAECTRLGYCG